MKYFTLEELCATKTGLTNIPNWQAVENLKALVNNVLDPLRESWGKPIIVTSGFRCKAVNDKVGGAKDSHHMMGCCADITTGSPETNKQLFDLIVTSRFKWRQLIDEKKYSWIHIEYNEQDNKCQILHL